MRLGISVGYAIVGAGVLWIAADSASAQSTLPPVPVPPANPITEAKRVLGKILFWDEQLSSDNTTACGTCHRPDFGGADALIGRHPGLDGIPNSPDDILASLGVIRSDSVDDYLPSALFGLNRQVTNRAAQPVINVMFAGDFFWDGRARSRFTDPQTGAVLINSGGGLESQAIGPVVSDVEMAHAERDWPQITTKLASATPLALATSIPPDMADAIASNPTYPALFAEAFGDSAITASRIAFAIATYERTLVSDQSPWDRFIQGQTNALTPGQQQGWQFFQQTECAICHQPPLFTDNTFRNIGLRPLAEDQGRMIVTGIPADRGRFKTPSLRNLSLRLNFMHTGQFASINQVFPFYAGPGAPGNNNRDPILPSPVPPQQQPAIIDFILNGLLDPRVANQTFPFDRPTLWSERPANPTLLPGATPGTGGQVPRMIAACPPNLGNTDFKIGVDRALAGAQAFVAVSTSPPVAGVVDPSTSFGPIPITGSSNVGGFATFHWPIPPDPSLLDQVVFMQWRIEDPAAAGGIARSTVARLQLFGTISAPPACPGDTNGDNLVNGADLSVLLAGFGAAVPPGSHGDLNGDALINGADLSVLLSTFGTAC